jgi:hypothetical protein
MPTRPAIQPLSGSSPVSVPAMITPKSASQKNSYAPNLSARLPRIGVKRARKNIPISVPSTEPDVAMPIARPASPCFASAWPSRHDAADAGVPGILSRIAERDPP